MIIFTSKKALFCILSASSILLAGAMKNSHSTNIKTTNIVTLEKDDLPIERNVASEGLSRVAVMWLPINESNNLKINSMWEITRIVGNNELVVYDKLGNATDAKKSFKIKMELIKNGIVKINNDEDQVYRVSLLSDFGTIALYKKMNNGFEIIEARKVSSFRSSLIVSEEVELVLERALNPAKSNKVLQGADVVGRVSLSDKMIKDLAIELRNTNGEIQNVEIASTQILDAGTFRAEVDGEDVSGVVLNNGKDGYRISFVTGPIAGSMINFVTKEQLTKLEENLDVSNSEEQANVESEASVSDQHMSASIIIEERKEVANDADSYEPVRILSADEIKETTNQQGFSF